MPGAAAPRRAAALVLLAGLVLLLPGLGNRDLWNPNEPVFAEGAREMLARGDFLVPWVNGALYVDKPILYFWAILAGSAPVGRVTETAARLPSALASILLLVAVYRFGATVGSVRAGLLSALALATMPIFLWEGRFAQMDPMLSLFMFCCVASYYRAREGGQAWWLAASGAWAGLAFLTKGPVGLVLPGAAALVHLTWERDLRFLRRPAWLAGAGAFALVGLPWYIAVWTAGHHEWLTEFFLHQNLTRFVDPFDHAQPFYYYGIRFLADLFPWSLLLPLLFVCRPQRTDPGAGALRLWTAYALVVVGFFSLSGAKRGVYILPMYPAYALLVGSCLDRVAGLTARATPRRTLRGLLLGVGALLVIGGVGLGIAASRRYPEFATAGWVLGGLLAATGIATAAAGARREDGRPLAAPAALMTGLAIVYLVAMLTVAPRVDPHKSARAFSEKILAHAGQTRPVQSFRFWKWRSEYLFYTERLMPILGTIPQVEEYFSSPVPVFLLVEESDRQDLEAGLRTPYYRLESDDVGEKRVTLLSNRPALVPPADAQADRHP
jgi:4-amino-4-deoxy-L-arabinose transferase-like glycosyltransferase